jgi:hypothetical protein
MTHDVEGAPGVFALTRMHPNIGQASQKRIERGGSAREKRNGIRQIEFGWAWHA